MYTTTYDLEQLGEFRDYLERKLYRKLKGLREQKQAQRLKQELQKYSGKSFVKLNTTLINDY